MTCTDLKSTTIGIRCDSFEYRENYADRNAKHIVRIERNGIDIYASDYTEAKARDKMRCMLEDAIAAGTAAQKNTDARVIACGDGTTLVVRFVYGSWCYEAYRATAKHAGCSTSGFESYVAACTSARNHATTGYGGILWESGSHLSDL